MSNFLRVSEAASLGMHAMVRLAAEDEHRVAMADIAEEFDVSAAHLAKVLQRLAKAGFVQAVRGPGGGYVLAQPAADITLLDVYEAIEGECDPASCLLAEAVCGGGECCLLGGLIERVNQEVESCMSETTLAELVQAGKGLRAST